MSEIGVQLLNFSAINYAGLSVEQFVKAHHIRAGRKRLKYAGPVKFFSSSSRECLLGRTKIGPVHQLPLTFNNLSKGSDEITK